MTPRRRDIRRCPVCRQPVEATESGIVGLHFVLTSDGTAQCDMTDRPFSSCYPLFVAPPRLRSVA